MIPKDLYVFPALQINAHGGMKILKQNSDKLIQFCHCCDN